MLYWVPSSNLFCLRWLFLQPPIHQLQAAGAFSGFSSSLMNIWVSFSMLLHYYLSPNFKLLNGHWTSGSQFLCSCTYDHNEPQFLYLYMNMTDELRLWFLNSWISIEKSLIKDTARKILYCTLFSRKSNQSRKIRVCFTNMTNSNQRKTTKCHIIKTI